MKLYGNKWHSNHTIEFHGSVKLTHNIDHHTHFHNACITIVSMFFMAKGHSSAPLAAFCCHVSLVSFSFLWVSQPWHFWRLLDSYFVNLPQCGYIWLIPLIIKLKIHEKIHWQEYHESESVFFLLQRTCLHVTLICPISD
jgi:hypothetical protein